MQKWNFPKGQGNGLKPWMKVTLLVLAVVVLITIFAVPRLDESSKEDPSVEDVATGVIYEQDFFADYRRKRESWRSDEEDLYRSIINDDYMDAADKSAASADYDLYLRRCELEDKVEEILKGRGYSDVIFSIEDNLSFLILQKDSLSEEERNDLSAFVEAYAGVDGEKLTIFTAK
ncbi:MAG TPA: SpoIIIAH-like family protein [Firmicutes bacterium]|nr:SpoIIIAH-like family protein [Bacillota bacterium]